MYEQPIRELSTKLGQLADLVAVFEAELGDDDVSETSKTYLKERIKSKLQVIQDGVDLLRKSIS